MVVSQHLPAQAVLAMGGATLVSRLNSPDPTNGVVRYRDLGLPARLRMQYEAQEDDDFHRYALVDLVGSFETAAQAEGGVWAGEYTMRLNPAPGVVFSTPVDEQPQPAFVTADSIPMGFITTRWDPTSRSIVNITSAYHLMRDGFVVRQISFTARNVFVTTFGEGRNLNHLLAWLNGTGGSGGFKQADYIVAEAMSRQSGYLSSPLPAPPGAEVTYWSAIQGFLSTLRQQSYVPL